MKPIHISYARRDLTEPENLMHAIVAELERRGWSVHYAERDFGHGRDIVEFIENIRDVERVLCFFSESYFDSKWCCTELWSVWNSCANKKTLPRKLFPVVSNELDQKGFYDSAKRSTLIREWRMNGQTWAPNTIEVDDVSIEEFINLKTFRMVKDDLPKVLSAAVRQVGIPVVNEAQKIVDSIEHHWGNSRWFSFDIEESWKWALRCGWMISSIECSSKRSASLVEDKAKVNSLIPQQYREQIAIVWPADHAATAELLLTMVKKMALGTLNLNHEASFVLLGSACALIAHRTLVTRLIGAAELASTPADLEALNIMIKERLRYSAGCLVTGTLLTTEVEAVSKAFMAGEHTFDALEALLFVTFT